MKKVTSQFLFLFYLHQASQLLNQMLQDKIFAQRVVPENVAEKSNDFNP